jgi:hypothetical protein
MGMKYSLAQTRIGRALLHTGCILRGGRIVYHARGIRRELRFTMPLSVWFRS